MENITIINWEKLELIETSDPSDPTAGGSESFASLADLIQAINDRAEQEQAIADQAKREQDYYKRIGEA